MRPKHADTAGTGLAPPDKVGPDAGAGQARGYRANVARLSVAQKSGTNAPAYTRFANRALGRRLAAIACVVGLTPNQVTLISALVSWIGVLLVALVAPTPLWSGLAVIALLLGYALDSADGQLARLTNGGSPLGEWLDHVLDSLKVPGLHLAVLVALYRFVSRDDGGLLLPAVLYTLLASAFFFTFILTDHLRRINGDRRTSPRDVPFRQSLLRSAVLLPTDFGVLCVCMLLLPWIDVFRVVYLALLCVNTAFVLAALRRWGREMRALSQIDREAS